MISDKLARDVDRGLYDWAGFEQDYSLLLEAEFMRRMKGEQNRTIAELSVILKKLLNARKSDEFEKVSKDIEKEQKRLYSAFVAPLAAYYGDKETQMVPVETKAMEKNASKACNALARKIYYTANRMGRDYEKELKKL